MLIEAASLHPGGAGLIVATDGLVGLTKKG
jgi:hypothetical protein